jgi:uncharacterized protein YjiS (DUF1127 family)
MNMATIIANRAGEMREGKGLGLLRVLSRVSFRVADFRRRRRAQAQLEALDDRLLSDIGVDRSEIRNRVWGS